jgi:probable F420-dependent oxidoreductase
MDIGIIVPPTEIGPEPDWLVRFARAVEDNGFAFLVASDHVVGADWAARGESAPGPANINVMRHEVFVLLGFLAAHLKRIELSTGVLVLPQRQTALVAKQCAEIDVLTHGRFRLGIGTGWNFAEYETLGSDFHNRGVRSEEQIEVMRMLWTQDVVDFTGKFHVLNHVGILPRPVQRPIPVWIGGGREDRRVHERIGRIGDGWLAPPVENFAETVAFIRGVAEKAGRDPASIGLQRQIELGPATERTRHPWPRQPGSDLDQVRRDLDHCRADGIDKVVIRTPNVGRLDPEAHVDMVVQLAEVLERG